MAVPERSALIELARQWISLWTAPLNRGLFEALHAEDFADESPAGRGANKAAFRRGIEDLFAAFPDLRAQADDFVVDESAGRVAVRWSAKGTNRARFLGHGPTNKPIRMTGIEIIEFRGAEIIRRWGEWDISEFLSS